MTLTAADLDPAWWNAVKYGRVRLGEVDVYDLYELVRAEEIRRLQQIWDAKQAQVSTDQLRTLKLAKKRMERIRFQLVDVIREKGWNLPADVA